jgi:hypothetical protein
MAKLIPTEGSPRRLNGYPTYAVGYGNSFFIALDSNIADDALQNRLGHGSARAPRSCAISPCDCLLSTTRRLPQGRTAEQLLLAVNRSWPIALNRRQPL